jgi:hypothetical protein
LRAKRRTTQNIVIELDSEDIELAIASYCREQYFEGISPNDVRIDTSGPLPRATVTCTAHENTEDLD